MTHAAKGRRLIPAGTLLFLEGDTGNEAFLIQDGFIEIYVTRDGMETTLATRGAGELVGEVAILDDRPRSASARAVNDCHVVVITAEQLSRRIAASEPVLRMCLDVIIERYRDMVAVIAAQPGSGSNALPMTYGAPASGPAVTALLLEQDIVRALEAREFELFFQPIVRLATGRIAGFEALIRWRHPTRGLVPPMAFIPAAEASGFITELTQWCIGEVARVLPEIRRAALGNVESVEAPFVTVNITGADVASPDFASTIAILLGLAGVEPSWLKLEVTESLLMRDPDTARTVLAACRDLGLGIAIDDFGTGYSSLAYLTNLPITTLKIDRSFISPLGEEPTSARIVQMILRLAEELSIPAVAEGIETEAQAQDLTEMRCEFGQGYLFGKPVPLAQTLALIRNWGDRRIRGGSQPALARIAS